MKKLGLLTLHGMGEADPDYPRGLRARLLARLGSSFDRVALHAVHYQFILQPNQEAVWARMLEEADALEYQQLRKFMLFGIADAAGLVSEREEAGSAYEEAQLEIARTMTSARVEMGRSGPLLFIAQSLGGQLLSSYIFDAQKARRGEPAVGIWRDIDAFATHIKGSNTGLSEEEKRFLAGGTILGFLTTGCNIPIFVAAHRAMRIKAISPPTHNFRWINFYDRHDVLGWPLRPLRGGYESLVEDREINAGQGISDFFSSATPLSHLRYWEDLEVVDTLGAMIAAVLAGEQDEVVSD